MRGDRFDVEVPGATLVGCVRGTGPEVLLLHGGPGISGDFFDELVDELEDGYRVAWYQQRGVLPSTPVGPYDVGTAASDAVAVLDALGWQRAVVGGFSYGGNLLMHLVVDHPDRLVAAVAIDPMGATGDGGEAGFSAGFLARLSRERIAAMEEFERRESAGEVFDDETSRAAFANYWPGYFAEPDAAPPLPDTVLMSGEAASQGYQSARDAIPALTPRLAGSPVPTLFVHGGASPMPVSVSEDSAVAIGAAARVVVVPGSGHFVWYENPGAVRAALDAFLADAGADRSPV